MPKLANINPKILEMISQHSKEKTDRPKEEQTMERQINIAGTNPLQETDFKKKKKKGKKRKKE